MPQSVYLLITGKVQGVGFRSWTVDSARMLGVSGWVRNRRDGNVEALFHGEAQQVGELIQMCWAGPSSARVAHIEPSHSEEIPPPGFTAKPTV